jgi:Ca-activated chloride channel homolog
MGWKLGGSRQPLIVSSLAALLAAGGIWPFGVESRARAQEAPVNIEPRAPRPGAGEADRALGTIRVESNLVLIPVMVTDQQDRSVTGLQREHFRLWDEKTEQVISHFASDDTPVSIGLVFDASGSMGKKLKRARAAIAEFLRTANPQDEFSLVRFNDHAQLMQAFTDRVDEIQAQTMFIQAKGSTALLDGLVLSMNEMQHAKNKRKAILIISDGGDNSSRYSLREVKNRLRESDVQVYSIGIVEPFGARDSLEELTGPALLDDLAKQTGGRLFEVDDLDALPAVANKIGAALRNQYVLGYVPGGEMRDGKYHRVQVKIARPKGLPAFRTSFRSGYFAPAK